MAMKDHAKNVCTIHRWRVAWRTVAEIHHPRMKVARARGFKQRMRLRFFKNREGAILFKPMVERSLFEMARDGRVASASPLRRGMPCSSLDSEPVEDFFSAIFSCTGSPTETILNLNLYGRCGKRRHGWSRGGGTKNGVKRLPTRKRATVGERTATYIEYLGPTLSLLLPSEKRERGVGRPPRP
jgi:hypothetical protein